MNNFLDGDVGVLTIFLESGLLLLVELSPFDYFGGLLEDIGVIFDIMLESHFHVLHSAVEVADLPHLLSLSLNVEHAESLFSLPGLGVDSGSKNGQFHYFLEVHIALSVNLNLEVVDGLFLLRGLLVPGLLFFRLVGLRVVLPLVLVDNRHINFLGDKEIGFLFFDLDSGRGCLGLDVLVGDLVVDDLDGPLENEGQFKDAGVVVVDLVEL